MTGKTITTLVLILTLVALLAYDALALWLWGYDGTISLVVFNAAKAWPIIPFLSGVVCGHFFFSVEGRKDG